MTLRPRFARAAVLSALAVAASTAIVLVAIDVATGATLRPGSESSHNVEFIDPTVLQLSWLLAPMLGIAAFFSARVAVLGVTGVAVSQFWATAETVGRYQESGWGDGLEVLGFLFPIGLTLLCLVLVLIGGLVGGRRRAERQDQ